MRRLFSLWSVALGLVAILAAAPWELHGKRAAWAEVRDPCGVAVIIGNGDYEHRHVPDVTYVHREAEAFKGYVLTVLGFDPVNFIDLRDGRRRELYNALGTRSDPSGSLLWSCLHGEGGSDVLVFYSVHGVPGQGDGRGYVLPVDADPKSAEDDEYSMDLLYENLGRLAARSVTFLDTCFSGGTNDGGLIGSASPVYVKASLPEAAVDALYGRGDARWQADLERERKARELAERERLRPGREFRDCGKCPEMVVVPAGEYMMGSREGEGASRPRHRMRIGKAFAVGRYEVTFGEWDACVAGGGCQGYRPDDEGWGRGRRPVVNVNWRDAKAYVTWLSERTGARYRLLSEAEWEYVARAGTSTAYWWGDNVGGGCVGCRLLWDDRKTAPVGRSFWENGFGLYDVHGNVWEWVDDCWHENYDGAPTNGSAWVSGGDCGKRVLRGGSWFLRPRFLRSAVRNGNSAGRRHYLNGFRVARTLTP